MISVIIYKTKLYVQNMTILNSYTWVDHYAIVSVSLFYTSTHTHIHAYVVIHTQTRIQHIHTYMHTLHTCSLRHTHYT